MRELLNYSCLPRIFDLRFREFLCFTCSLTSNDHVGLAGEYNAFLFVCINHKNHGSVINVY